MPPYHPSESRLVDEAGGWRKIASHGRQRAFGGFGMAAVGKSAGALQSSTLRRKIMREDYEGAADEFPRWVFAAGRRLAGLVRRREAERILFLRDGQ